MKFERRIKLRKFVSRFYYSKENFLFSFPFLSKKAKLFWTKTVGFFEIKLRFDPFQKKTLFFFGKERNGKEPEHLKKKTN